MSITLKTPKEIEILRQGGRILAQILDLTLKKIKPGVSAADLDAYAEELILKASGYPSFKNYQGFPGTICVSPNAVIVHGIPKKDLIIKKGDIVGIDIGMRYPARHGFYTDMARTVGVGKISHEAKKLISTAEQSFFEGLKKVRPGSRLGDLGASIQAYVEKEGFSVVRSLCGHGVGYAVHEEPRIPNYGQPGIGEIFKTGMVLAIEPMVCAGHHELETGRDGWTAIAKDRKLTAHYENTVVVTADGCAVLTVI